MPKTEDLCGCPRCPPGTPLWRHLAIFTIKREEYLKERYFEVLEELKRAHIMPPPDADFKTYRQYLIDHRRFLPTLYLSLVREYFSLRDEMKEDFFTHIVNPEKDPLKVDTSPSRTGRSRYF